MSKAHKILITSMWAAVVVAMVLVLAIWHGARTRADAMNAEEPHKLEPLLTVPAFSLTDQNGKTVTADSLRGHVWIASFIFTQCAGPCPMISKTMVNLQSTIPNPSIKLVSFTVDPEHDSPDVLKHYANELLAKYAGPQGVQQDRWYLLTGSRETITNVQKEMKVLIPSSTPVTITHSTVLMLVDTGGTIRGIYHYDDAGDMAQLPIDAQMLAGGASQ